MVYKNQASGSDPSIFAQYSYDGSGNRVFKMVRVGTGASPIYGYNLYIDGIFEYQILDAGTTFEKNYVHIMDDKSRIASVRIGDQFPDDINEATTYNLENQIGSSTCRLNDTGGVIDIEEYYPFGDSSLRTFTRKRFRYVGKEKDSESGLYYYGARYYAAWTCRFISIDPLAGDYAQLTPYNYANNGPIDDFDIDGMQDRQTQKSKSNSGNSSTDSTETKSTDTDNLGSVNLNDVNSNNVPMSTNVDIPINEASLTLDPNYEMMNTVPEGTVKFTYTMDYTIVRPEYEWIPFNYSEKIIEPTGTISDYEQDINAADGYNVTIRVPIVSAHNESNPSYSEYRYNGSTLAGLSNPENWTSDPDLLKAFGDGFRSGVMIGLSSAVIEQLSYAIQMRKFNLTKLKSFEGASPDAVKLYFEKIGWKPSMTSNGKGWKFVDPNVKGQQVYFQPANQGHYMTEKTGDYLRMSIGGSRSQPIPLFGNPSLTN